MRSQEFIYIEKKTVTKRAICYCLAAVEVRDLLSLQVQNAPSLLHLTPTAPINIYIRAQRSKEYNAWVMLQ
jgi:hypothetical protein